MTRYRMPTSLQTLTTTLPPLPPHLHPLAPVVPAVAKGLIGSRTAFCFWKRKFSFSNFSNAPIFIDENWYQSTEHWYQASKARFFNDTKSLQRILDEVNSLKSLKQKKYFRMIQGLSKNWGRMNVSLVSISKNGEDAVKTYSLFLLT